MVFQDALSALNPVFPVGWQIGEMFRVHEGMSKKDARVRVIELMERVRIPAARERIDEPTTALDVTVQAQIMELLRDLQRERKMGLILITHDLGVVADVADKISVMYAGRIMEKAVVGEIYARPSHPYTKGLLESIPRVDLKGQDLSAIQGLPPSLTRIPPGCEFNPRCPYAQDICREKRPALLEVVPGRFSACHFAQEVLDGSI
jgi:oligopeptide transport system ATP-binding protein